jgi:hypothetical protein
MDNPFLSAGNAKAESVCVFSIFRKMFYPYFLMLLELYNKKKFKIWWNSVCHS